MNSVDVIARDLIFGPFKTELLRQSIDEKLRLGAIQYLEEKVLPLVGGEVTRMQGAITSHYDSPQFLARPELTCRYYLKAEFDSPKGIMRASGELVYDTETGTFTESRLKPLQVQLLKARSVVVPINKPKRESRHFCFNVAEVEPSTEPLPLVSLNPELEHITRTKLLVCPDSARQVVQGIDFHPLIAAAAIAFQKHYPLVLSPDSIWLTILQGVSQHIQNHAERLRSRLVSHVGKLELVVNLGFNGLPRDNAQMLAAANAFCAQITRHLLPEKRSLLQARFSTTTETEQIAASVVIMDAFQRYFDYVFGIICGIPSIILEGTVADWELLENKVLALDESDLDLSWWTGQLVPLCRHFSRAAAGDVDVEHWKNLCKIIEHYGVDDLNGWLLKFIPYVRQERNERLIHRNPVLMCGSNPEPRLVNERQITGCTSDMLPSGVSSVPVTLLNGQSGALTPVRFIAGVTGLEQAHEDLGLRPVIGWAIAEPPLIDVLIQKLRTEFGCPAPNADGSKDLFEGYNGALTGELWRYFTEIDTVGFEFHQPNQWGETTCRILPIGRVKKLWDDTSVEEELDFLFKQGLISGDVHRERWAFAKDHGSLVCIANANGGELGSSYVFGNIGPNWSDAPGVYHWTGERRPEAFVRVADSFPQWLATLIQAAHARVAD